MKKLLTFSFILFAFSTFAQNDEADVKATINRFFEGFKMQDSLVLKETLGETCSLKTIAKNKAGEMKLQDQSMASMIKSIGTKNPSVALDERLTSYHIKIDDAMAMAWTPYEFYVNEKFNHCGVDMFTLMKTDKGWKIVGIVDTRRKENCVK